MALMLAFNSQNWTYAPTEIVSVWVLASLFLLIKLAPGPFLTFSLAALALISALTVSLIG